MKTSIISATAALLLGTLSLTSCKKDCDCDKDKKVTEETTTTTPDTVTVTGTAASGMDNTTTGSSSGKASAATRGHASVKTGGNGGGKSTLSHPAKDGTDAENHDGDYYTRNDTARKPTGSIK